MNVYHHMISQGLLSDNASNFIHLGSTRSTWIEDPQRSQGYGGIGESNAFFNPIRLELRDIYFGNDLYGFWLGGAFELYPLSDFSYAFVLLRSPPPLRSFLLSSLFSGSDTQRNHQFPSSRLILFEEGRHQQ
ncbi:hypothetical protein L1887_06494 [Cichorium endivia]|nr:hypothetical protein L1887_06494 [Cichorium endivia]